MNAQLKPPTKPLGIALALVADAALVLLFATLGRSEHARDATVWGVFETAWPFLAGLAIMWFASLAFRRPLSGVRTGIDVWVGTVAIGMGLRLVSGSGAALPFVIVATLTLGVFLLGWRGIVAFVTSLRRRGQ